MMKKTMTKLASIGLVAAMAGVLGACGSSSSGSASGSGSSSSKSSSAAAESTKASSSASGEFSTVEKGKLHMATNAAFPPYESTSDDGGYEGIDIDVANKIANDLGLKLVVDDMDFSSVITAVQGGKDDIAMAGMSVTKERKKNLDFTDTYATTKQMIIVPKGSDIKSAKDLANNKQIGVQEGTTAFILCSDTKENGGFGEDHVTAYTNGATAVQALLSNKVDCVVIDNEPAKQYVAAHSDKLKILKTAFTTEDYAIGVSKKNPQLRNAVNNELKKMKKDGTIDKIVNKYIHADSEK